MRTLAIPALTLLALVSATPAQVVRGGDLVVANFRPAAVYRVTPAGATTALNLGGLASGPSGVAATRSGDVVVADFNSGSLIRIDAATGNPVRFATNLGGPLRVVQDLAGDFAVTSNSQQALLRVTPGGVTSTIASGAPLNRPFDVALDGNGDYLVTDDRAVALFRVTPAGAVSVIHQGSPFRLPQGAAVFPNGDYAVFDGLTDSVFRVDRTTSQVTTFVSNAALGNNPCGIVEAYDGGFFLSTSSSTTNLVRAVNPAGAVTTVRAGPPFTNLEDITRVPFVVGPNGLTTGPGSSYTLGLDIPAEPSTPYTLTLSASVFPGWPLAGADPRRLTINPDALFFATVLQNAPPILVNWTAVTDPMGRAMPGFDLSILPPGVLSGTRLFLQGFTLTPTGIGTLSNVLPIDFP